MKLVIISRITNYVALSIGDEGIVAGAPAADNATSALISLLDKELYDPARHRVIIAEQSISEAGIDLSFHHVPDPTNWNGVAIQRCPTCRKHFRTDLPHTCARTSRRRGM